MNYRLIIITMAFLCENFAVKELVNIAKSIAQTNRGTFSRNNYT